MPELPEVETIKEELSSSDIIESSITSINVSWEKSIATHTNKKFIQLLVGNSIKKIKRRGKYLLLILEKHYLLVHLRMTGKLSIIASDKNPLTHERVRIDFKCGQSLIFQDTRKFGRLYLVPDLQLIENKLGPEPLSKDFSTTVLQTLLKKKKQNIKAFLLDQKNIAGLGNIYVDEALFLAGISPYRNTETLTKSEISKLYKSIKKVLVTGIKNRGTSLGDSIANYQNLSGQRGENQFHLYVYKRGSKPCLKCKNIITKVKIAGRGTHFCPNCQL